MDTVAASEIASSSPSLRGSGLKFESACLFTGGFASPSLRGSGLKSGQADQLSLPSCVSLFTREWIEIVPPVRLPLSSNVSLFTREWIEILMRTAKSSSTARLPLYEGVD